MNFLEKLLMDEKEYLASESMSSGGTNFPLADHEPIESKMEREALQRKLNREVHVDGEMRTDIILNIVARFKVNLDFFRSLLEDYSIRVKLRPAAFHACGVMSSLITASVGKYDSVNSKDILGGFLNPKEMARFQPLWEDFREKVLEGELGRFEVKDSGEKIIWLLKPMMEILFRATCHGMATGKIHMD